MSYKNKTLLLVENDAVIADNESTMLHNNGFEVSVVYSGEQAVEYIKKNSKIDLVLMEIDLGDGIDGTQAARMISNIKDIPVIFLTNNSEKESFKKMRKITRYGYVIKNTGDFVLLSTIDMAFDLHEMKKQKEAESKRLQVTIRSIGDAFITTDINGVVEEMNPVAEQLTGWKKDEAIGKKLKEVFEIRNRETLEIVSNPIDKVLTHGKTVGLANHTVLISKNGQRFQISDSASPIKDDSGSIIGVVLVFTDVTEKYEREESLIESRKRYKTIFEKNKAVTLLIDAKNGDIIDVNNAGVDFYGWNKKEFLSKNFKEIASLTEEEFERSIDRIIRKEKQHFNSIHLLKDGSKRNVEIYTGPIELKGRTILYSIIHDITDRIKAENRIKELLREKELLLREVHHRIKNNMTTIINLLSLQADASEQESVRRALQDANNRVISMIGIYDKLYKSNDFKIIYTKNYLEDLVNKLILTYNVEAEVSVEQDIDEFKLDTKILMPVGIIVNEIISNSFKYAFKDREKGSILIKLKKHEDKAELVVADDGLGIPEDFNYEGSEGFGMNLINILVAQIGGDLKIENDKGTSYTITFMINNK